MSIFARQLMRGSNFGKQLQSHANIFGRQIANTARQISTGVGKAEKFVSSIERAVPDGVPIIDKALKPTVSGLKSVGNVSDLAGIGGNALRQASAGNFGQAGATLDSGKGLVSQLSKNVTDTAGGVASFL